MKRSKKINDNVLHSHAKSMTNSKHYILEGSKINFRLGNYLIILDYSINNTLES